MYYVPTTDPRKFLARGNDPTGRFLTQQPMLHPASYGPSADQYGHSGQKLMQGKSTVSDAKQDAKKQKGGDTSKWVGAFKIAFSLLVTGGINAFLFGVPIWVAGGISAAVAASQSAIALKIHKEDTDTSQKIVRSSRKLMGRQNDKTPSGKEWSMVPVWAGACGLLALVEAMANHTFRTIQSMGPKGVMSEADIQKARKKALQASIDKSRPDSLMRKILEWQMKGMKLRKKVVRGIRNRIETLNKAKGWQKKLGGLAQKVWNQKGGRSMKAAYIWGCGAAMTGAVFQTSLAAMMQQKIDRKHGVSAEAKK